MPTETGRAFLPKIDKPWLAGCTMQDVLCTSTPTVTFWLKGKPVPALLDSVSAITLACPVVLSNAVEPKESLAVT